MIYKIPNIYKPLKEASLLTLIVIKAKNTPDKYIKEETKCHKHLFRRVQGYTVQEALELFDDDISEYRDYWGERTYYNA